MCGESRSGQWSREPPSKQFLCKKAADFRGLTWEHKIRGAGKHLPCETPLSLGRSESSQDTGQKTNSQRTAPSQKH